MKIKKVTLDRFKRFTDLTITDISETARLIILVGPNGSGKTSLFEALNHWYILNGFNCDFSRAFRHLFFTTIPPGPAL